MIIDFYTILHLFSFETSNNTRKKIYSSKMSPVSNVTYEGQIHNILLCWTKLVKIKAIVKDLLTLSTRSFRSRLIHPFVFGHIHCSKRETAVNQDQNDKKCRSWRDGFLCAVSSGSTLQKYISWSIKLKGKHNHPIMATIWTAVVSLWKALFCFEYRDTLRQLNTPRAQKKSLHQKRNDALYLSI